MRKLAPLFVITVSLFGSLSSLANDSGPKPNEAPDSTAKSKLTVPLKDIVSKDIEVLLDSEDVVSRGKHGVRIRVKNNSDRAIMFNGDAAVAVIHGTEYPCLGLGEFDDLSGSQPTFISSLSDSFGDSAGMHVAITGLQTKSDLLKKRKPTLDRFLKDDLKRKESDQGKFGQRILWPGDSSSGTILFQSSEALNAATLKIPVYSFFDATDKATASNQAAADK